MIFLILAILSSTLISILMRLSEQKRTGSSGMFIFNYAICTLLAIAYGQKITYIIEKQLYPR